MLQILPLLRELVLLWLRDGEVLQGALHLRGADRDGRRGLRSARPAPLLHQRARLREPAGAGRVPPPPRQPRGGVPAVLLVEGEYQHWIYYYLPEVPEETPMTQYKQNVSIPEALHRAQG